MENDMISYNISDIENISMTNGKLEFKLKKKEIEEKKPKINNSYKEIKDIVSQYYDNYLKFRKAVKSQSLTTVELEFDSHIQTIKGNSNYEERSIRNCFEHAVAYLCHMILEKIEVPWEIQSKIHFYEVAIRQPYPELGEEIQQKILDEAKIFVTETFLMAYKYLKQKKRLNNEHIKEKYEDFINGERDERQFSNQCSKDSVTKELKEVIENVTLNQLQ